MLNHQNRILTITDMTALKKPGVRKGMIYVVEYMQGRGEPAPANCTILGWELIFVLTALLTRLITKVASNAIPIILAHTIE